MEVERAQEQEWMLQQQRGDIGAHAGLVHKDDGQRSALALQRKCSQDGDSSPVSSHPSVPQQQHRSA